tara:strand:- start:215 stop:577 length:363 start_codon:yes stop_codon:yes gene_type:complete
VKKLLLALMLLSPLSFAEWGDVYYCQMTSFVGTDADGTVTQHKLEKFQFRLDEAKKSMVFGKSGFFKNSEKPLALGSSFPRQESWRASDSFDTLRFKDGKFFYASAVLTLTSITANCDKF